MGVLDRLIPMDEQWEWMSRHIIGGERTRGSPDAIIGCSWNSAFRFSRWSGTVGNFVREAMRWKARDHRYGNRQGRSGSASGWW